MAHQHNGINRTTAEQQQNNENAGRNRTINRRTTSIITTNNKYTHQLHPEQKTQFHPPNVTQASKTKPE